MIDIHVHLLPGIDDGPKSWDQALALCNAVREDGVCVAVATPHLIDGVYNNVRSRVVPLVEELNERLAQADISLEVRAGAEVDFSSRHVTERSDELPLLGDGSAVLLEMPVAVIPPAISETIFALRARGITPVIAHPERNEILQDAPDRVREWIAAGALLQLDGDSLLGIWGRRTQACAESLLKRGLFHAMASDAHSVEKRPPRLRKALERVIALVGEDARKLVDTGPDAILHGRSVPTPLYEVDTESIQTAAQQASHRRKGFFGRLRDRFGDHL